LALGNARLKHLMNRSSIKLRVSACFAFVFAILITGGLSADVPPAKSYDFAPKQQVITFLTDSIAWYRHLSVERQIATDLAARKATTA
jgi:hypothetical protein